MMGVAVETKKTGTSCKVHSGPVTLRQRGAESREDRTLVYVSPPLPIQSPDESSVVGAFPLFQLEHSVWTPGRLRGIAKNRLDEEDPRLPVKRRLRSGLLLRWTRGISENEPHAVEAWYSIVAAWLRGQDHVKVAEDYFLSRRWAYELVSRYLGAASYYLFADDLRAGVCRQTHPGGGSGHAFNRDGAGLFAETCSACVLLRGADWEGWVAIEESA